MCLLHNVPYSHVSEDWQRIRFAGSVHSVAWTLHRYLCCTEMCIQKRPLWNALATLILTAGWALCDTACVSTNRSARPKSQSVGFPESLRRNPPSMSTSKPREAAARVSATASETSETANKAPTSQVPSPVSTGGESASTASTAASTPSESPSMIVTTSTQRSIDTQIEQTSRRVWPFLLGVAIAAVAGLALLIRRPRIRAR